MDKIKKALDKIQRYRHDSYEQDMVPRKRGQWILYEDAKTAICQAVMDYEAEATRLERERCLKIIREVVDTETQNDAFNYTVDDFADKIIARIEVVNIAPSKIKWSGTVADK
jgi:hypothetical protein